MAPSRRRIIISSLPVWRNQFSAALRIMVTLSLPFWDTAPVNLLHPLCVLAGQTLLRMTKLLLPAGSIVARMSCIPRGQADTVS